MRRPGDVALDRHERPRRAASAREKAIDRARLLSSSERRAMRRPRTPRQQGWPRPDPSRDKIWRSKTAGLQGAIDQTCRRLPPISSAEGRLMSQSAAPFVRAAKSATSTIPIVFTPSRPGWGRCGSQLRGRAPIITGSENHGKRAWTPSGSSASRWFPRATDLPAR